MRTLVDIPREDRAWLDCEAKKEGVSMAEMVRRAVKWMKSSKTDDSDATMQLLKKAQGRWKKGDGLAWQLKMRDEWER